MANTKKPWIYVLIAVFVFLGISAIGLVVGSAYWISRHVNAQVTSTEDAATEFSRERARFAGQQPLFEVSGGDNPTVRRLENVRGPARGELTTLHARIYDPDEGKLVRADIPFWLVRTAKSFSIFPDMGSLTLEDLEQHGPGLLVNGSGDHGEQILVWID